LADIEIIAGEARETMAKAKDNGFNLIICDGFIGGKIPSHLITYESLKLYLSKLAEDGILCFHLSNDFIDYQNAMAKLFKELSLVGYMQYYDPTIEKLKNKVNEQQKGLLSFRKISDTKTPYEQFINNCYNKVFTLIKQIDLIIEKFDDKASSHWVVAARDEKYLATIVTNNKWSRVKLEEDTSLVTDEYIGYNEFNTRKLSP
jgi:hypothetical protein